MLYWECVRECERHRKYRQMLFWSTSFSVAAHNHIISSYFVLRAYGDSTVGPASHRPLTYRRTSVPTGPTGPTGPFAFASFLLWGRSTTTSDRVPFTLYIKRPIATSSSSTMGHHMAPNEYTWASVSIVDYWIYWCFCALCSACRSLRTNGNVKWTKMKVLFDFLTLSLYLSFSPSVIEYYWFSLQFVRTNFFFHTIVNG